MRWDALQSVAGELAGPKNAWVDYLVFPMRGREPSDWGVALIPADAMRTYAQYAASTTWPHENHFPPTLECDELAANMRTFMVCTADDTPDTSELDSHVRFLTKGAFKAGVLERKELAFQIETGGTVYNDEGDEMDVHLMSYGWLDGLLERMDALSAALQSRPAETTAFLKAPKSQESWSLFGALRANKLDSHFGDIARAVLLRFARARMLPADFASAMNTLCDRDQALFDAIETGEALLKAVTLGEAMQRAVGLGGSSIEPELEL